MKITLTHPYCWPYVRRGSERFITELARYLVGCGHEVTTISSRPGKGIIEHDPAIGPRVLHRQIWTPALARVRLQALHMYAPGCLASLLKRPADVVQSLHYIDSWCANQARRFRGFRTVFHVTGPPVPQYLPRIPPDRMMMRVAIQKSDMVLCVSEFVASFVREHYSVDPVVLPIPVDLTAFVPKEGVPSGPPTFLGIGSFDDRRKGVRTLVRAFAKVKETIPDASLRLSGRFPDELQREVLGELSASVRRDIEVLGVGRIEDLPEIYRSAHVTTLPSMWEAFGMTAIESWASGTPVVASNHGGLGNLADDPEVSVRFDPQTNGFETDNVEGLTKAMLEGLELAGSPCTIARCRKKAETFDWERLGPEYESLLVEAVKGR